MPGFLYFIPRPNLTGVAPSAAELAAAGLAYAFEGRPHFAEIRRGGPGGTAGALLVCRRRFAVPGKIELDLQKWVKHPSGKYWVGAYHDQPLPQPADLQRESLLSGYRVELADGRKWAVPVARQYFDSSTPDQLHVTYRNTLPHSLGLNDEGRWEQLEPLPRYRHLHAIACEWNDYRRMEPSDELRDKWDQYTHRVDAAVEVLAANYVVGPLECSALFLGLLTFELADQILDCLIDEPEVEQIKKKWLEKKRAELISAPAGSNSSPGPGDETPPTPPPSPT